MSEKLCHPNLDQQMQLQRFVLSWICCLPEYNGVLPCALLMIVWLILEIIFSSTCNILKLFFTNWKQQILALNWQNAISRVIKLSYLVSNSGLKMLPSKIKAIQNLIPPYTKTGIRRILSTFYQRFCSSE